MHIEYTSQDDATAQAGKWDEARCSENAQGAAQDESIVGWIGPFNSGCATVEIPILNEANLAMVSPANTALGLTKEGGEPAEPEQYYPTGERNYTRVIVADDKQGRAGAVYMRDLGAQSVYILDDQETYGKGPKNNAKIARTKSETTTARGRNHKRKASGSFARIKRSSPLALFHVVGNLPPIIMFLMSQP